MPIQVHAPEFGGMAVFPLDILSGRMIVIMLTLSTERKMVGVQEGGGSKKAAGGRSGN